MHLPRKPGAKEILNGSWAGQVVDYLRAITLRPGRDYTVSQYANGTTIQPRPVPKIQPGAGASRFALQVVNASTEGAGKVTVVFGTVTQSAGGITVPDMAGGSLSDDPAPELAIATDGWVYLHLVLDEGEVDSVEIKFAAAVPANDATNAYHGLALITGYDAGPPITFAVLQNVSGSQYYQLCGSEHLFGRV